MRSVLLVCHVVSRVVPRARLWLLVARLGLVAGSTIDLTISRSRLRLRLRCPSLINIKIQIFQRGSAAQRRLLVKVKEQISFENFSKNNNEGSNSFII
jgi:hypothetical protein